MASISYLANQALSNFEQVFIIVGIVVNCGGNADHHYIGGHNWFIGDAPFVGGIGGFASVFVTASFACKAPKPSTQPSPAPKYSDS
jgi:hypothetical protein